MGRIYNPEYKELAGNRLQVLMNSQIAGWISPSHPAEWFSFALDMPELQSAQRVDLMLRTTRYLFPPPPDVRVLGLLLDNLLIAANFE